MSAHSKVKKAIEKATDPGLRVDNWGYLIEVCDLVKVDAEDRGDYAMKIIEERLLKQDANMTLRTLSLVVALAENCGSRLQQAISSKNFTGVLYKIVDDSQVHVAVKREVLKTVHQLADSFKADPSLKYMHDLERRTRKSHPELVSDVQVPKKKGMSKAREAEEEKELAEALRLSLLEYKNTDTVNSQQQQQQRPQQQRQQQQQQQQQTQIESSIQENEVQQQAPTVIRKVRAMYDFNATELDELSFKKGDLICVVEQVYRDWWRGTLAGRVGIFPLNYVTPVTEPSPQEQAAERTKEEQVFAQKDNVDKLQNKLREAGNGDITQDQEVNDLYGSVSPIRPQISKMLGKYAQKKEDLVSLRQILANAEISYNQLLSRASNAYAYAAPAPAPAPAVAPTPSPAPAPTATPNLQSPVSPMAQYTNPAYAPTPANGNIQSPYSFGASQQQTQRLQHPQQQQPQQPQQFQPGQSQINSPQSQSSPVGYNNNASANQVSSQLPPYPQYTGMSMQSIPPQYQQQQQFAPQFYNSRTNSNAQQ
ncbi:unnamed protein product [Kluyveromyces dobzhanskii CBS 2104]|uniref:Class E vacuolar protein-sorting machinery protein HSE1 n=1 Tax=Kluyveromyces dobzhanskii CBS 2104 TaxID=1427455 RepID=A0A0A8LAL0_9SACH|nr:unnamed protein product [Kluyveromyces dobzhanskii CBS 2104]